MKYLKVYTDFVADMNELGDAERGRLFTAMLLYAKSGEEPTFKGNEKFIWGTAKKNIDSQRESYSNKLAALDKANQFNPNHNGKPLVNHQKPYGSEWKTIQEQEQEQEHKQEQNKINKFIKPTVEEVSAYCRERQNNVDPETFIDFYESKGWKVGNQPMKDWKAAVRTWEKGDKSVRANKSISANSSGHNKKPVKDYSYLYDIK